MRWTRKKILAEIKRLYEEGAELYYSAAERDHLNLVRAAAWHFGTWRLAVEQAGIDYESLSRYKRWNRERVVQRIQELHAQGADLSWRSVSMEVDPALAAAALRSNGFSSWREAIAAAGLDIEETARYKYWNEELVLQEIQRLHRAGEPLSSKHMQDNDQSLFCAARRRFGSWDNALDAAGLDHTKIRLRRAKSSKVESNGGAAGKRGVVANGSTPAAAANGKAPAAKRASGRKATAQRATTKRATTKRAAQRKSAEQVVAQS